jgi:ribosomal protein S18 acetylase RimI-like enzyme
MQISIRNAKPSDSKFLTWVLLEATHSHLGDNAGLWNIIFPDSENERLEYLEKLILSDHISFCHYSSYLIAEVDGTSASALTGFDPKAVTDENFLNALVNILPETLLSSVLNRMASYTTCLIEPHKDSWVIDMVATIPDYRRLGLSNMLLQSTLQTGYEAGFRKAEILILIGNLAAQRVYEKVGFKIVEEKKHPEFEQALNCPGVARMIMEEIKI